MDHHAVGGNPGVQLRIEVLNLIETQVVLPSNIQQGLFFTDRVPLCFPDQAVGS